MRKGWDAASSFLAAVLTRILSEASGSPAEFYIGQPNCREPEDGCGSNQRDGELHSVL